MRLSIPLCCCCSVAVGHSIAVGGSIKVVTILSSSLLHTAACSDEFVSRLFYMGKN